MATSLHKDLPLSERHAAISYEYADATARNAATGFVTADLGKFAWQQDDDTVYILTATSPTWVAVGGSGGGVTALAVTDIADPSIELNAIAGSANGDLRLCYQVAAGADTWTLYAWDSAVTGFESVPYTVDGASGRWAAIGGSYISQAQSFAAIVTLGAGFTLGGHTPTDILISSDALSTSDTALVTPGYIDALYPSLTDALLADGSVASTGAQTFGAGITMGGITPTDILVSSDGASTSDTALVTAGYVDANAGGGGVTALSVTDIDDPSTELNAIAGSAKGELRLCYQTVAGSDEWTLYAWDDADSVVESVPTRVDGSSGMWSAVAGYALSLVVGPASATDNAIARYDSTTGELLQDSLVTINDAGQVEHQFGTAAAPAMTYAGDTDTGFYRNASVGNFMHASVGGAITTSWSNLQFRISHNGLVGFPSLVVGRDDTDSGFWSAAANIVALSTGGTEAARWDASQVYTAASHVNPDTDSANDLGLTGTRWRNLYVDDIIATTSGTFGGDIDAAGGFRRLAERYLQSPIASTTYTMMINGSLTEEAAGGYIAPARAGSAVELSVWCGTVVGGQIDFWVEISTDGGSTWGNHWGSSGAPIMSLDSVSNPVYNKAAQAKGTTPFTTAALLRVRCATNGTWDVGDARIVCCALVFEC